MYKALDFAGINDTWLRNPRTKGSTPPPIISLSDMSKGLISSDELFDALGFGEDDDTGVEKDCAVLYYPQAELQNGAQVGHYTAIVFPPDDDDNVHYFDSYGSKPDEVERMARDAGEDLYEGGQTELLKQLVSYGNEIGVDWNETAVQSRKDPRIATCGLWALDRCFHADLTNSQFLDVWKYRKTLPEFSGMTMDEIVVKRWSTPSQFDAEGDP